MSVFFGTVSGVGIFFVGISLLISRSSSSSFMLISSISVTVGNSITESISPKLLASFGDINLSLSILSATKLIDCLQCLA
uniref:Putative secreted protein n=1 Tax=Panstrongylus lignarius TaxID=156445 RepID=A0A224XSW5_9HEMI